MINKINIKTTTNINIKYEIKDDDYCIVYVCVFISADMFTCVYVSVHICMFFCLSMTVYVKARDQPKILLLRIAIHMVLGHTFSLGPTSV